MFAQILARVIKTGSLAIIDPSGRRHVVGDGTSPAGTIRILTRRAERAMIFRPTLALGEGYMDGTIRIEDGPLYDVLAVLAQNADNVPPGSLMARVARATNWLKQRNPAGRARRNVAHHYDLSPALYDLFLDSDRQYSCAYFATPDTSLEEAQAAKKRHIAAKLLLDRPGLRVLDIGSGWGGLGLYLAAQSGAEITGVTLSVEQQKYSMARVVAAGMEDHVRFDLRDYRHQTGPFDRIVSVGMFEHVGKRNYDEFFAKLGELLAKDGVAMLHTCGFTDSPGPIDPFIRKYIFPGADIPALSEISEAAQRNNLIIADVEVLRLHYAETLRAWRQRFCAHWDDAAKLYDERFCRMWEFYLALCEVGFRYRTSVVFQLQITHRLNAAPVTRDYMLDWERQPEPGQRSDWTGARDSLLQRHVRP
ncbi:cyclopropane-fatty-acyl-phospholipid synthase family protein [Acidisphaera sp. L21]|uniref:SAM-dependent methyltransferase n=1 Tax=Acidisphaera sp. L21 TaxID=1641851 RepID=UPI00131B44DE|nr:cyclopropane-fatty-acyl-phospholipid synthase family protein [Acidisphaera sp. L21]